MNITGYVNRLKRLIGVPLFCAAMIQPVSAQTAAEPVQLIDRTGVLMFDYQSLKLPGNESIDLLGYHVMTPVNNWLSIGVGSYAPVSQGDFGGFMAFGAILHAQKNITDRVFATGGLSFGGGGGGRSVSQSVALSGTGGFVKGYLGLGYQFEKFAAGVNVSRLKFLQSSIDSTQANLFLQIPFGYQLSRAGDAGTRFSYTGDTLAGTPESMITVGLDNYAQRDPVGSFKGTINAVDLQYSRFFRKNTYWYYALGVGYGGRPLYNQAIAGIGARYEVSPKIALYGQLGIGSGGYAPSVIDTGSGLLVYPKVAAEYLFSERWGVAATAGYLAAPDATSKNLTFGLALTSHFNKGRDKVRPDETKLGKYVGYRLSFSNETKVSLSANNSSQDSVNLFTLQADRILNDHFYVPIRGSIAYEAYTGFPGYGEISIGLGVQSKYSETSPLQYFADLQAGANVEGAMVRAAVGVNYGLTDTTAIRGALSQAYGEDGFRSTNVELGLTYRFSMPRF